MLDAAVSEILRGAREILGAGGWCQRAEATDARRHPMHPAGPAAVCWSATGAIYAAARFDGSPERRSIYEKAVASLGDAVGASPVQWNDAPGRTKEQVLEALDGALRGPVLGH